MGVLDEVARARLRDWLKSTGETQTDFGNRIGRNQAWMSRYLDAEFDADLTTLQRIADAQNITLWQLLDVTGSDELEAELIRHYRATTPTRRELAVSLLREWRAKPEPRSRK